MRARVSIAAAALVLPALVAVPAEAAPSCFGRRATIVGTKGDDRLRGTNGPDVIHGLGGSDVIKGRGGNDVICGGRGNDPKLIGGDGADVLKGGSGNDRLAGEYDLERKVRERRPGDDVIDGGPGSDWLFTSPHPKVTVHLVKGRATGRGIGTEKLRSVENARGSRDDDTFVGNAAANRFVGLRGQDDLDGGRGDDVLEGWGDRSELRGDKGDDTLFAGVSDIVVHGGAGSDTINLSTWTASLYDPNHPCDDSPARGWEVDISTGRATSEEGDTIEFRVIENVVGSDESDRIRGDGEDNRLRGLCGNDILEGRDGDDSAVGGGGDDFCMAEREHGCEQ